jgi:hypothetical protein
VGRTAGPGDTCVIFDGVYNLGAVPLVVSVENLIVRSMNGATATIIQGLYNGASDQHRGARRDLWRPGTLIRVSLSRIPMLLQRWIALCVTDDRTLIAGLFLEHRCNVPLPAIDIHP